MLRQLPCHRLLYCILICTVWKKKSLHHDQNPYGTSCHHNTFLSFILYKTRYCAYTSSIQSFMLKYIKVLEHFNKIFYLINTDPFFHLKIELYIFFKSEILFALDFSIKPFKQCNAKPCILMWYN